jgi:hypothetical protein
MEPNQLKPKTSARDFFINLGAVVALGMVVGHLINLLFTIINKAYPIVGNSYGYYSSSYSISWPVATLIIFFPIYILLMWLLERSYKSEPEKRNVGIRKWLTYITLFVAGLSIAGDLVTVIYYFIDGRDLTAGFISKALSILVIALAIFFYYIRDVMGKLNAMSRKVWVIAATVVILGVIIWGFSVIGSPRTQRLYKYDEQKVADLSSMTYNIENYYRTKSALPATLSDVAKQQQYPLPRDEQFDKEYEYTKTGDKTYQLCADFNKASQDEAAYSRAPNYQNPWLHPAGHHCFSQTVTIDTPLYGKPMPVR